MGLGGRLLSWLGILTLVAGVLAAAPLDAMALLLLIATPLACLQTWRRGGMARLGWRRPSSWPKLLGASLVAGVLVQALAILFVEPVMRLITGEVADLSFYAEIEGNPAAALSLLAVIWTLVAFGEEIVFRGFLLGELQRLGGGGRSASLVAVVLSSTLFGLGHLHQGAAGVWVTGVLGAVLGWLFVVTRRDLWLLVLTHGVVDTVAVVILYLGLYDDVENWAHALWA